MPNNNLFRGHDHALNPPQKRCRKCHILKPGSADYFYIDKRKPKEVSKICLPCQRHEVKIRHKARVKIEKKANTLNQLKCRKICFSVGDVSTLDFYTFLAGETTDKDALKKINLERENIGLPPASFASLKYAEKFVKLTG